MRRAPWFSLLLLASACGAPAAPETVAADRMPRAAATLNDVRWLLGPWQAHDETRTFESWTLREDGRMVGIGAELRESACERIPHGTGGMGGSSCSCPPEMVETESLEIVPRDGGLVYIASPIGQATTEFVVTEISPSRWVAENPSHDFPTRIEYRLEAEPRALWVRVASAERGFELRLFAVGNPTEP